MTAEDNKVSNSFINKHEEKKWTLSLRVSRKYFIDFICFTAYSKISQNSAKKFVKFSRKINKLKNLICWWQWQTCATMLNINLKIQSLFSKLRALCNCMSSYQQQTNIYNCLFSLNFRKCCVFLQTIESLPAKPYSIHTSVNMDSNPYRFLRPQTPPDQWEVPMLLPPSTLLSYPRQVMMSLAALWVTPINLERKNYNINFT